MHFGGGSACRRGAGGRSKRARIAQLEVRAGSASPRCSVSDGQRELMTGLRPALPTQANPPRLRILAYDAYRKPSYSNCELSGVLVAALFERAACRSPLGASRPRKLPVVREHAQMSVKYAMIGAVLLVANPFLTLSLANAGEAERSVVQENAPYYDAAAYTEYVQAKMKKLNHLYLEFCASCNVDPDKAARAPRVSGQCPRSDAVHEWTIRCIGSGGRSRAVGYGKSGEYSCPDNAGRHSDGYPDRRDDP